MAKFIKDISFESYRETIYILVIEILWKGSTKKECV